MNSTEEDLNSLLRKRSSTPRKSSLKSEIRDILEKQRKDIQEAGVHLIWKRSSEQSLKYDVVVIIPPKGFHIIDSLLQLINERQPYLIVEVKPHSNSKEQAFYITATDESLFEGAKLLGFAIQSTLTSLQRQSIILHYINSLRWIDSQSMKHEFKAIKFSEGEAVIAKMISLKLIKQVLPLHNEIDLSQLRTQWVTAFFSAQPLHKICEYYGMKIAIYFAFLGFYTYALIIPSILGLLITLMSDSLLSEISILAFTIINIIWSIVFLQKWKQTNEKMFKQWSCVHFGTTVNLVRPLFRGSLIQDVDSFGFIQIEYPEWKRKLFKYLITFPIIAFCLLSVFAAMFAVFEFQTWWDTILIGSNGYPHWTSYLPKILLALVITVFETIYYYIAVWLNNRENYRFESAHENNLILKLILFQFGSSFLPLFYIAFYIGDMDKLKEQLAALLITRQVIGNIKEAFLPFVMESYKLSHKIVSNKISQGEFESSLYRYESTFDDYLELVIQFGHVLLFSSVFPLAAVCALINNIIEIRSDAFKLCVIFQRPFAGHIVRNIGEWENLINYLVFIAIIVNCGLITKSRLISRIIPIHYDVHLVLIGVLIEHFLLALKWLIPYLV